MTTKPKATPKKTALKLVPKAEPEPKTKPKAAPKKSTSKHAGKKIILISKDNPRKPNSWGWKSFEIVRKAGSGKLTYEAYREKGGRLNDLNWDIDHGYVEMK